MNMTITELREKRAKLWNAMEGFLDTHRTDKGVLSAENDATYAGMEKDLSDLTNEIHRMERRDAIAAELAKPVSDPLTEKPQGNKADTKLGRASDAYKEDFGYLLRGKRTVHNVLSEGVDANGGYLVPEEFERQIIDTLKEENVMRRLCKVITTASERKIPVAATHSTAAWTAETASTAKRARFSALPPYSSVRWLKMAELKLPHIRSPCTCTISKPACFANAAALPNPLMISWIFRCDILVMYGATSAFNFSRSWSGVIFFSSRPGMYLNIASRLESLWCS